MKASSEVPTTRHLTAVELAERWRVQPWAIYELVRDGRLRALRIGRRVRFRISDVEAYEEKASGAKK